MKDMYPCGCMPGSRQGEPMQTPTWDSKFLARASSSVAHESRKLIFLMVSIVFPWKATLCVMLKSGNQIEKKISKHQGWEKLSHYFFYPVLNQFIFSTLLAKFSR